MTRTAIPTNLRRTLTVTTALGVSLGVFVTPAQAQVGVPVVTPVGIVVPTGISAEMGAAAPAITSTSVPTVGAPTVNTVNVALAANATVLDWATLNVVSTPGAAGRSDTLNFVNTTATPTIAVLNRVAAGTTTLSGQINAINSATGAAGSAYAGANGVQVWIANPNGLVLGPTGNFNGKGLVATTLTADTAAGNAFLANGSMSLTTATRNGITGSIGTIATNGGALVLLAPVINVTAGTFNAGTGTAAFVTASAVTITTPTSPFGIVIDKGVAVDGDGIVALGGTVSAGNIYAVVTAQTAINALLGISGSLTATSTGDGVVVLGAAGGAPGPVALAAPGAGIDNAGTVGVTVGGAVNSTGGYTVKGTAVTLGGAGIVQSAAGALSATASAGALTGNAGLSLRADTDGSGDAMTLAGTGIALAGTTLRSGTTTGTAGSNIDFTFTDGQTFTLGNVVAGTVSRGGGAAGSFTIGQSLTTGDLTLSGTNTIAVTGAGNTLQTGAVTTGANLTMLTAAGGVTVTGAIGHLGVLAGGVTIDGGTGAVDIQGSNLAGALTLTAGAGGATFTDLAGAGNKSITSGAGIGGTSIAGTGTVGLSAAAGSPISITGTLGTDAANRLGALTINGSNGVTIGTAGATGTTAFLTSASIGQGTVIGSLTVNGGTDHSGTFTSTSTNATTLGDVASGGALNVSANGGGVGTGALSGAGSKTIVANGLLGTIGVDRIRGAGAVVLTGSAAPNGITVANGIGAAGAAVASLDLDGGNATLGAVYVAGAARLGQGAGLGSLTQNGLVSAGSLLVTTSGVQSFNATVATTGATVLLSTAGLVTTTGLVNAGTDTGAADRSLSITGRAVSAGALQAGSNIAVTGTGTFPGARNVSVAGADAGTGIDIAATTLGTTTVSGNVTARGGAYTASGGTLSLTGGTQQATGAVTTSGGIVNMSSGVVVRADSDSTGGELLTVGDASTTQFHLAGSTLQGNGSGGGTVRFASAALTTAFEIGNVTAATIEQRVGGGAPGAINRIGDVSFGNLTLSGVNTITATGMVQTGALTVGNGAPALTLNGDGGVTVSGTIGNIGAATGGVTINSTTGLTGVSLQNSNLAGALTVTTGLGPIGFATLGGDGAKVLNAGSNIAGTAITGAGPVTLNPGAAGSIAMTGDIGTAMAPVASLTVTRGGSIGLKSLFVTGATSIGQAAAVGALTVAGAVDTGSLVSDSVGTSSFGAVRTRNGDVDVGSSTGAISFGGLVDGTGALIVQAAPTSGTTFDAAVGSLQPFASFTSNGAGSVTLNGGSLTTSTAITGTQSYGGQLVLGADTVLTGGGATFSGGIAGNNGVRDHDLTLNFSQALTLPGTGLTGVRNLSTDAAGSTTINGDITTSGSQSYGDPVTLGATVTLASSGSGAIDFAGLTGGGFGLTVTTAGVTTFNSGATGFATITTNGGGSSVLNGTMATSGAQNYADNVALGSATAVQSSGGGALTFGGTVSGGQALTLSSSGLTTFGGAVGTLASLTSNGTGAVRIDGGTVVTTGGQAYTGRVRLGANTTLTTGAPGSVVTFTGGVDGLTGGVNHDLTVNTPGAQVLGGGITGVRNLATDAAGTLDLSGAITTTGSQLYGEAVTLTAATALTAGTTIDFASTLDGAQTLATNAVRTTFSGDVGTGTALTSLQVTGAAATAGAGTRRITTATTQQYGGTLTLGADTILTGTTGSFAAAVDGSASNYGLTLTFSAANALIADPFVDVGALLVDGDGTTTLNGDVTTVGSQSWTSRINVAQATALTSSGNQAITLSVVTGNSSLAINTSGATNLNGAIAGITALSTNAGGTTTINTSSITTTGGRQAFGDDVVLGVDTVLTAGGAAAASGISFDGTVTGARSLTVNSAGQTTFNGAVGATLAGGGVDPALSPTAFASTGAGIVRVSGGAITTDGPQSYAGLLQLGADTVLTGTTGSFNGGIAGNGFDLRLAFINPVTLNGGAVGGFDDLVVDNAAKLSGTIATTGSQRYNGAVTLTGNTVLQSSAGVPANGAIAFASTINAAAPGAQSLTVTTPGTTSFGSVGATAALAAFTVNGTGAITFNGPSVTTTGAQRYTGAATLAGDNLLTTSGGDIGFAGTVDGPFRLIVQTAPTGAAVTAGTVGFGSAVGGGTALNGLAIRANAATAVAGNRVGTLAALVNGGGLTFADAAALTVGTVGTLVGVSTGTGAATITAGGQLTVAGNVTGTGATLTGTGLVTNAGTIVNAGAGPIVIDGNDGAITLVGTLTTTNGGAAAVVVRDAADVQLATIATGAGGTLTLGGAGGDSLSGAVTQRAGTTLSAGTLAGNVGGAATLTNANAIGTLGAFAATGLALHTTGGLAVTGPVDAGAGNLTLAVDGAPLTLQGAVSTGGVATITVGGAITQGAGSVLTAGTLTGSASGAVTLTGANRIARLNGFGVAAGSFQLTDTQALSVTADETITGDLSLIAVGLDFGGRTLSASGAATLTAGAGALTGATVVAASVTGSGDTVAIGTATATAGTLVLTATGGNLTLGSGTASNGAATLKATGTATLGTTSSGGAVTVNAAAITAGATSAATTVAMTSTDALTVTGNVAAGTAASFDAGGTASLAQVVATGAASTITIKALDAAITGTQRASTVTFVNRTPASNAFKLGTGTSTGGFALGADEINLVDAGQLTVDGGTGNVEIGTLPFGAGAGRTRVDVLATGRIDITGAVSGAGAGRTFRFGGTAASATDKASVIRVAATADAGGRLLFDTADLDLRGARIGVGQAAGFLDPIGFAASGTPLSAAAVGANYIGNPNSSLYNATYGGAAYTAATPLVSAHSLTVRYTDYALFQNTGAPGVNRGAVLGSAASPAQPALVLQTAGSGTNAFAIFGAINGLTDTRAAVSGSNVIQLSGADLANTRVNGCLAGSGAGCLTAVVSQPLLNIFDASRLTVFRAADDLALPFDPVVGTNNEALFSGFGLIDGPVSNTECSADTTSPACAQNKEQGK